MLPYSPFLAEAQDEATATDMADASALVAESSLRKAGDSLASLIDFTSAVHEAKEALTKAKAVEAMSALLWLYRRLLRRYGRQSHIEAVIECLARKTGADVAEFFAERDQIVLEGLKTVGVNVGYSSQKRKRPAHRLA